MKKLLALTLAACAVGSASAQVGVNLSIGVNQPGVYGVVNIGNVPPPALVVPQPVIIGRPMANVPPVYLYVPAYEQQHWRRYCGRYEACGRQVYFVREDWVRNRYAAEHPNDYHGHYPDRNVDRQHDDHRDRHDNRRDHQDNGNRGDRGDHGRRD